MKPYYQDDYATIYHGDCREVLPGLSPVDAVLTDPPYGLSFMGKKWDCQVPPVDLWSIVFQACKPGAHLLAFAGTRTQHRMACNIEDAGFEIRDMIAWVYAQGFPKSRTALKPALEPITLARRPLAEPTVAKNVLAHGTGALDIDGCRVGTESLNYRTTSYRDAASGEFSAQGQINFTTGYKQASGRFPANLIHDGSEEVLKGFPEDAGGGFGKRGSGPTNKRSSYAMPGQDQVVGFGDSGSAARFFYCAKASSQDRSPDNDHPTVKPSSLFRYLVQLITPPGATILDPFLGSGTTLQAAKDLNRKAIGIEIEEKYCEIAAQRLSQEVLDLGQ